ncbi:helix-turn-helix transcriptional regulator [Serratia quinivorans]|uniref:helix-turn-helix transcriptional regulator n=1 Tax=Serratia quinivorans TaxID=137545 RepID=UPI00217876C5|nr:LuxR C-terminal-related transcriptional regulator [Serratia quinivorans]CAI1113559.1 DNA-binding transcriptional activator BglJ [Serratia quinivorans]CAI1875397.1 DNA-binding transcriptional activator BglJ [Serratia quinivorans]
MSAMNIAIMEPAGIFQASIHTFFSQYPERFNVVGTVETLHQLPVLLRENTVDVLLSGTHGTGETLDDFFPFRSYFYRNHHQVTWLMWSEGIGDLLTCFYPRLMIPMCLRKNIRCAALLELFTLRSRLGHLQFMDEYYKTLQGMCCHLSEQELLIMSALAQGETPKWIAARLGRSTKTISSHKRNAMQKLGMRTDGSLFHSLKKSTLLDVFRDAGR